MNVNIWTGPKNNTFKGILVSVLGGTMNLSQKLSELTADPLTDFSSQGPISRSAVGRFLTLHQTVTHL